MHPFLCRASIPITRHLTIYCCCFSPVSTTNCNYNRPPSARNTSATECPLRHKFGEFYKRFYSAMAGVAVVGDDGIRDQEGKNTNGSAEETAITRGLARRNRRRRLAEIMNREGTAGAFGAAPGTSFTWNERPPLPRGRKLHPTQKLIPKERRLFIEKSTMQLTTRFLEHDRLSRELRAQIRHSQTENSHPENKAEAEALKKSISEEVELLKRTLRYISTHFYEPPTSNSQPTSDPQPTSDSPQPTTTPSPPTDLKTSVPYFTYLPPFPNFTSGAGASLLNRSLVKLLRVRPPPPALIPKLCYNLLTSPSPPSISTYNILIEGLTRLRHGSLGHIVFRNLIEGGLGPQGKPNEDTIVRMLNLCVKTADLDGFNRIIKITTHRNMATWWGYGHLRSEKSRRQKRRGKVVLETMIHGAARFGDVQQARVWLRAMRRECPENPDPSVYLLTSLIRMWTEMGDWDRGLRCWRDLVRLDIKWQGTRVGKPADLRAFRQMLKLCSRCEKPKMYDRVFKLGVSRGWTEVQLTTPVNKTKGLWSRRENKTPHIRGLRENDEEGTFVMEALQRLWAEEDRERERIEKKQKKTKEWKEKMKMGRKSNSDATTPVEKTEQMAVCSVKKPIVSDAAKSRIWDNVISRRMDDIRPASVSGGDVRLSLSQKRRRRRARARERRAAGREES